MLKKINYLIQAIIIYLFFLIGRILGINLSRKIFSFIFLNLGPLFKSEKIIKKFKNLFAKYFQYRRKGNYKWYVEKLWNDFYRIYTFR